MATFDIVFEGGGAKGTAFVGALEVLFGAGHKHRRLVGTSAGAITATLLGARYSPAEFLLAVNENAPGTNDPIFTTFMDAPEARDFNQAQLDDSVTSNLLKQARIPGFTHGLFFRGLMEVELYRELFSFVEAGGFYSGDAFLDWFRARLRAKQIDPDIRWKDFAQLTGSDVSVLTADVDEKESVILNSRTAPDAPVAMSVRMSMSIPFVWREVIWEKSWGTYRGRDKTGHRFVDGGVLSNFPIWLVAETDPHILEIMGPSDPTAAGNLGFLLDERIPVPGAGVSDARKPRLKTAARVTRLVDAMMGSHDADAMRSHPTAVCRIPAGGYGTTEFRMSKTRMDALIESGRTAMQEYLNLRFATATKAAAAPGT